MCECDDDDEDNDICDCDTQCVSVWSISKKKNKNELLLWFAPVFSSVLLNLLQTLRYLWVYTQNPSHWIRYPNHWNDQET
jgi:hypothetical protein